MLNNSPDRRNASGGCCGEKGRCSIEIKIENWINRFRSKNRDRRLIIYVNKKIEDFAVPSVEEIDTVILDMDGTLLDLHFDQEVWNRVLPERFAAASGCSVEAARAEVTARMDPAKGTLDWYCLDYWEDVLGINLAALEVEHAHLVRPSLALCRIFPRGVRALPSALWNLRRSRPNPRHGRGRRHHRKGRGKH
mgnify:CR=1 FL=1